MRWIEDQTRRIVIKIMAKESKERKGRGPQRKAKVSEEEKRRRAAERLRRWRKEGKTKAARKHRVDIKTRGRRLK